MPLRKTTTGKIVIFTDIIMTNTLLFNINLLFLFFNCKKWKIKKTLEQNFLFSAFSSYSLQLFCSRIIFLLTNYLSNFFIFSIIPKCCERDWILDWRKISFFFYYMILTGCYYSFSSSFFLLWERLSEIILQYSVCSV